MPAAELRPRSASELVDATFQVVRGHYLQMLVLSVIMGAPSLLVSIYATPVFRDVNHARPAAIAAASALALAAGLWFVVVDGALVWYTARVYLGERAEPADALRAATARAWRLVATSILRGIYIVLGMLPVVAIVGLSFVGINPATASGNAGRVALAGLAVLFAFVAIIGWLLFVVARYFPLTPVVMFEEHGILASVQRAATLMKGAKWRAAALATLAFVVWMALSLLVSVPIGLLRHPVLAEIANVTVRLLLYPLFAALVTLLYYDQRVRKEAFDIEHMSSALGGDAAFGAAGAA